MVILGLTGSIGVGKSVVARLFRGEGAAVFDADATIHQLLGNGGNHVVSRDGFFSRYQQYLTDCFLTLSCYQEGADQVIDVNGMVKILAITDHEKEFFLDGPEEF